MGHFSFFFTLSCADKRWNKNITSVLEEKKFKIRYDFSSTGNEETFVGVEKGNDINWIQLKQFIEEEMDESIHEILRRNVVTATRNYQHRVKAFIKAIMLDSSNPMLVQYYSAKVEFQGRGAAHIHGTIWISTERMEFMMYGDELNTCSKNLQYNFNEFDTLFHYDESDLKEEVKIALFVLVRSVHPQTLEDSQISDKAKDILYSFGKEKLENEFLEPYDILRKFKLIGMRSAFKKFQTHEPLMEYEETAIINFANTFTSVSLSPATSGKEVVDIVKSVNMHRHTKACRKYSSSCRFCFPKYPIWKTILSRPAKISLNDDTSKYKKIFNDVKEKLMDEGLINKIMSSFDKDNETEDEYMINREKRIKLILAAAGYELESDWELYVNALSVSKGGYSIVMARDIDEIFVNSYNREWILAWNGNMDLQVCLDFFAIITYITEYFTKDDTGTMSLILDALKNSDCNSIKDRMIVMMNNFMTHGQIGEAEAIYKIFPDFHFKESNISTVGVPNCPYEDRSKFLIRSDDKPQFSHLPKVEIENHEGYSVEKYDIVSKYQRTEGLEKLSLAQFCKMYEPSWKVPKENETKKPQKPWNENNKFHYVMADSEGFPGEYLPATIKLSETFPYEPPFMRKKKLSSCTAIS